MRLAKSDAAIVTEAMANTKDGAGLGFPDYVAYWLKRDAQPAIKNIRSRYPALTDQELEWKTRFDWISDWPNGWYLRGMARRLATGDIAEFSLFMQMYVRQSLLNLTANEDEFTEVWPLFHALAIQDQPTVDQYVKIATFPLKEGHPDTRLIYNCVHALLCARVSQGKTMLKKRSAGKTPDWIEGIIACMQGVIAHDASQVAVGMEQHLQGFRKATRINPLEKIISLVAHGLYRLAERIDPDLVAQVDIARDLPWDREFHDWSSIRVPTLSLTDFGKCPGPLAMAFVALDRPSWVPAG